MDSMSPQRSGSSDLRRRVARLEAFAFSFSSMLRRLAGRLLRGRKVNARSRELTKEETASFKRQMEAHGVEDKADPGSDSDSTLTPARERGAS